MYVTVRNARDRNLTSVLKTATHFYAYMLMSPQLIKHLSIRILVHDNLGNANGYCSPEDCSSKLRSFEIDLQKMRTNRMLKLLAHEMVHVKQFAKNELKERYFKDGYKTLWHGEVCDIDSYWDQPWEIEAFTLEEELLCYFKKEYEY